MRTFWFFAVLAPALAGAAGLEYGQPYACNGERFIVYYCRGDSDAGAYVTNPLDNYCSVTYIDRPRVNGFLPQTAELRGDILKKLVACSGTPAAPDKAPATGGGIEVPGTGAKPIALARLPEMKNKSTIFYVDELSRRPTAQADVTAIWALWVYPQGKAEWPGVAAHWVDYRINCRANEFELLLMIRLDREAKPLGAGKLGTKNSIPKGTAVDDIAGVACQRGAALAGPRLTSTAAAIRDAMQPAPAASAQATPANPKDVEARADALINSWTAAFNRADYDGALAHLREYAKLYPNDPSGYLFAGYTYNAKGDKAGAERSFLQAQRVAPDDPQANFEVGKLYLDREDKTRARTELLKVLAQKSAKADALIPAGELLVRAGDETSATEAFRRGVQLPGPPKMLARGWAGFGRAQAKAGRTPQAIAALNEAIRLDPDNEDAHRALWGVYDDQGNLAGALAEAQAIARLSPADAWAQYTLGNYYAALKQMTPAIAAYDKAVEMAPKDPMPADLLSLLSDAYRNVGRPDRALASLRAAIGLPHDGTIEGANAKLMDDFARCHKLGPLLVGQRHYPEVIRLNFTRNPCMGHMPKGSLGIAYVMLRQPQEGIPELEEALEGIEKELADDEARLSDPKLTKTKRRRYAESLAELKSESAQELLALGRAYLATGRKADAQRTSRRLSALDKNLAAQLDAEISAGP
jgi:tetratricopeptide (TPR) repeat protein